MHVVYHAHVRIRALRRPGVASGHSGAVAPPWDRTDAEAEADREALAEAEADADADADAEAKEDAYEEADDEVDANEVGRVDCADGSGTGAVRGKARV